MRRRAPLVAGLGLGAALVAASSAPAYTDPGLNYLCGPPLPLTQQNCSGWHNVPVTLVWNWDKGVARPLPGQCGDELLSDDSDGGSVLSSCTVADVADGTTTSVGAKLKIDRTPPTVLAAAPSRPPDLGAWWNHPVGFAFSGSDATSGIAWCDSVGFAGPGSQVVGGCHDAAGNYATRGFPLSYDAIPPRLASVKAAPGNRGVTVSWTTAADTVSSRVTRSPGKKGRAVVYSGVARRFRDAGLVNGRTYHYTVTVLDQAGNRSSKTVAARPELSLGLVPRRGARLSRAPLLRWPAVRGARYYNVQLYRGRLKLLTAWPARARLRLHRHWSFQGRRFALAPGRYRWYVWPGYGSRAAHRFGAFVGQSSFVVVR
jgi:hypothetical protein